MSTALRPLVARQYRARLKAVRDQTNARAQAAYAAIQVAEAGRRETVAITPAMAAEWLKHPAVDQPPLDQAEVDRIAVQIGAGDWQPDPADPIQLAPGDGLLNGQHRLAAIIAAGVTVQGLVAFDVIPNAIQDAFDGVAPWIARYLQAGKGAAASLSAAFLTQLARIDAGVPITPVRPPVAVAKSGLPLAEAIGLYVVPSVLDAIKAGRPVADAIGYGDFLVNQFADSEVLRSADETIQSARDSQHYVGWEGQVSAGACDTCASLNSGTHAPDEPLYRHANCGCEEIPIFEAIA